MASDFDRWMAYHGGAYPAFLAWVREPENRTHVEHMRRLLGPYTYDQLKDATDAVFASETQPRGFGSHARAIRQHIQVDGHVETKDGPQAKDGRLTAECWRCMDYGTVEVVSPATLKLLWQHDTKPVEERVRTCMIACDCNRGDGKARRLKVPRWSDNTALFRYEEIMDAAADVARDYDGLLEAEWSIARQMLLEHHDKFHAPQELTPESLR